MFLETLCVSGPKHSRRLAINTEQPVAFHAVAEASQSHLGKGQNIIFETVLLDLGNGFHVNHGVFEAPAAGVYVFSVSVMNVRGSNPGMYVNFVKNGGVLSRGMADGSQGGYSQGSITAAVQLQVGDEVWCEVYYPEDSGQIFGGRYSTFTGFLLFQM